MSRSCSAPPAASASDRITRFVEKPKPGETESHWISAGLALLEPEVFAYIPANPPSDFGFHVFPAILAAGRRLNGYRMGEGEGLWWVDTPADYARMQVRWKDGFPDRRESAVS